MNNDAEAIKQLLLAWLLQESDPAVTAPSGKGTGHSTGLDESGANDLQAYSLDPIDSEDVSDWIADPDGSSTSLSRSISSLEFGEIPAVQDRFEALLKRRLRAEIERNPPRFPWETESFDYDTEYADAPPTLIPAQLWMTQLQSLRLPVPMPEPVLTQLFDQCRAVLQSSLREGTKLVRAVESLFPGQEQALNQLANWVLAAPSRGTSTLQSTTDPQALGFPSHFDAATPAQQMALSLLAVKEMLAAMTFKLSSRQPMLEHSWLTDLGTLKLVAEYQPEHGQVRIEGTLPHQGSLCFRSRSAQTMARCATAGVVSVELVNLEPNQTYFLDVQFESANQPPLVFAVDLVD